MKRFLFVVLLSINFSLGFDKNINAMSADFIQYQSDPKEQKIHAEQKIQNKQKIYEEQNIYYSGSFMALSPHFAKWEYKQPFQKIVYLDDKTLISYEPLLQQAIYTKINQKLNFLKIIQNAKQDSKDKNLFISEVEGQSYRLSIQNDLPARLEYEDALGNPIVIEFKNVLLNPKISKEVFIFSPPEGVDIIKQ